MVFLGYDLNDVAGLQFVLERDHAVVDFRSDALVANLRVDHVGEIDRCCPLGKGFYFPTGSEYINLVREKVDAHVFHEFARIPEIFLVFDQFLDPGVHSTHPFVDLLAFLIAPVGGDA